MARLIAALLPILFASLAHAQSAKPEVGPEPINMLAVAGFLVLFFGSIVGYVIYLWWEARHSKAAKDK
jgi:hypothetical protein